MKKSIALLSIITLVGISLTTCKKDEVPPANPYDNVVNPPDGSWKSPNDSSEFLNVQSKIFKTKCALPGCHDGHFEPDFRTPQSSHSTLVYAKILKNNATNNFTFRVIPHDTARSVLYERITNCCFVNPNDRMPQDNIGVPLPSSDIKAIADWIMHGARDMYGNKPVYPDAEPEITGWQAVSNGTKVNYSDQKHREDTTLIYSPMIIPKDSASFLVVVIVKDDSTLVKDLQYNKLKISTDPDDFTTAYEFTGVNYSFIPSIKDYWIVTVQTAQLPKNTQLYMRYFVKDKASRPQPTFYPRNETSLPYKSYFSFKLK